MKVIVINSKRFGIKHVLVSDIDYPKVNKIKWHVTHNRGLFYARNYQTKVLMHRLIKNVTDVEVKIDHKDHNGLNNQRCNLRKGTHTNNLSNRRASTNGTSKFLGVCYSKCRWRASISCNNKKIHLGLFINEEDAAKAYDTEAKKLHGKWANLNFK